MAKSLETAQLEWQKFWAKSANKFNSKWRSFSFTLCLVLIYKRHWGIIPVLSPVCYLSGCELTWHSAVSAASSDSSPAPASSFLSYCPGWFHQKQHYSACLWSSPHFPWRWTQRHGGRFSVISQMKTDPVWILKMRAVRVNTYQNLLDGSSQGLFSLIDLQRSGDGRSSHFLRGHWKQRQQSNLLHHLHHCHRCLFKLTALQLYRCYHLRAAALVHCGKTNATSLISTHSGIV